MPMYAGGKGCRKGHVQKSLLAVFKPLPVMWSQPRPLRRDKLDSQFIVAKFSILHVGGRSLFIFHIGETTLLELTVARSRPPIRTLEIEERD